MRINSATIPYAQVSGTLTGEVSALVEKFEDRNGTIVAVAKRGMRFNQNEVNKLEKELIQLGYDQFALRIHPDGTVCIVDGSPLEQDLDNWVKNEGGQAAKAADKIKKAFYENRTTLDLSSMGLRTIPVSAIGQLTNLQNLSLSHNELPSLTIPDTLTSLQNLSLYNNKLTSLTIPDTLTNLQNLYLYNNELPSLTIPGTLTSLQYLDLSHNELPSLTIPGTLTSLETLYLSNNELPSLTIPGTLTSLQNLDVSENSSLSSLPMLLSECINLTFIDTDRTLIPEALREHVLAICRERRNAEVTQLLPKRLDMWSAAAVQTFDFSFIENFTEAERQNISEWLLRLEKTRDFHGPYQKDLAGHVCQMLLSLRTDAEFKEAFFAQVAVNLEACEDRAAMSFNEIFLLWKLRSLPRSATEQDRLKLMIAAAKTLTLRKEIAKLCHRKNEQGESVEVYLYYELQLKEKLNLLTAIHGMRYGMIGKRSWVDEQELEKNVRDNYLASLCELPSLKDKAKQDPSFVDRLDKTAKNIQKQLEQLEKETTNEGEYIQKSQLLKMQYEDEEQKALTEWAQKKIEQLGLTKS